ncbi:hypothetical protein Purlil1_14203 [Purpureocillium lilacinum]|uniref:Uncharacterized protein n=1 Tax=Purpureocillium lilacinum TaxID=33203 RepID=A0ABR0BBZ1_PURLI|nr:hypothetical protein Purlil1_14203 [Purpureocillium lilacinum]
MVLAYAMGRPVVMQLNISDSPCIASLYYCTTLRLFPVNMDIEEVTAAVHQLDLNTQPSGYRTIFERVIARVGRVRHASEAEKRITRQFSRPYTQGGLLVLLLQPRSSHPWDDGADAVISDCATLDSLNEGLRLCHLRGIGRDVSVLDLWPLLPPAFTNGMSTETLDEIASLVLAAVGQKRPDCILSMGQESGRAIRQEQSCTTTSLFWKQVPVVFSDNPSRSVNHERTDSQMRQRLLSNIEQACDTIRAESAPRIRRLPTIQLSNDELETSNTLYDFLKLLSICCFEPTHLLPMRSLVKGERPLVLEDWHKKWLVRMAAKPHRDQYRRARANLVCVFEQVNNALELVSWYEPTYKVNWRLASRVLVGRLSEVERDCCRLASDVGSPTQSIKSAEHPTMLDDSPQTVLTQLRRITARGMELWDARDHHPPRAVKFVGFRSR